MRCRKSAAHTALAVCACGAPGMANAWAPTWVIEGDPTLSLLEGSKSEIDTCIGRTNRHVSKVLRRPNLQKRRRQTVVPTPSATQRSMRSGAMRSRGGVS